MGGQCAQSACRFGPDGAFSVMQISDVQDAGGIRPRTRELLTAALDREKPDLAVFSGDQLKGYSRSLWFGDEAQKHALITKTLDELLGLLEERGIPFTFAFGNHDHDAPMDPMEQLACYRRSPLCLAAHDPDVPGYANHVIPVEGSKGGDALLLYFLDTHNMARFGAYAPLEPDQVEWYRRTRDAAAARNGGACVPSMLFQHYPVEELYELFVQVPRNTPGAFEGWGRRRLRFFKLDEGLVEPGAFAGELPSCPAVNAGLFDAALEKGEMMGMFFGHDHSNGFCGAVRGVRLGYAPGAGYASYGLGRMRGVRVFRFREGDPRAFETYVLTDEQLLGEGRALDFATRLVDKSPTSFGTGLLLARDAAVVITAVAVGRRLIAAGVRAAKRRKLSSTKGKTI